MALYPKKKIQEKSDGVMTATEVAARNIEKRAPEGAKILEPIIEGVVEQLQDLGLTPSLLPRKHPKPVQGDSTTFEYRDPDKRREYQREYQKARRAKKAAERAGR